MKNFQIRHGLILMTLLVSLFLVLSCTTGKVLRSHVIRDGVVGAGPFTAIFYSTAEFNFLKTVAILDIEGDGYEIKPFGAEFDYTIVEGLGGKDADRMARELLRSRVIPNKIELRAINDLAGNTIGYEFRHLQLPFVYGVSDVLDIIYVPRPDGMVIAYIRLADSVERMRDQEGGGH